MRFPPARFVSFRRTLGLTPLLSSHLRTSSHPSQTVSLYPLEPAPSSTTLSSASSSANMVTSIGRKSTPPRPSPSVSPKEWTLSRRPSATTLAPTISSPSSARGQSFSRLRVPKPFARRVESLTPSLFLPSLFQLHFERPRHYFFDDLFDCRGSRLHPQPLLIRSRSRCCYEDREARSVPQRALSSRTGSSSSFLLFEFFLRTDQPLPYSQVGVVYDLVSVVSHVGTRIKDGHYLAQFRTSDGSGWARANDTSITSITAPLDRADAYILVYTRRVVAPGFGLNSSLGASLLLLPAPTLGRFTDYTTPSTISASSSASSSSAPKVVQAPAVFATPGPSGLKKR